MELEFAGLVARKFAAKHNVHLDESIAEAWYWTFRYQETKLFAEFAWDKAKLGRFLKCRLHDYFIRQGKPFRKTITADMITVNCHMDAEMLSYLSGIMANDEASFAVFEYLKRGMTFQELEFLDYNMNRIGRDFLLIVRSRLNRLYRLKKLGLPITRELHDASFPSIPELPSDSTDTRPVPSWQTTS